MEVELVWGLGVGWEERGIRTVGSWLNLNLVHPRPHPSPTPSYTHPGDSVSGRGDIEEVRNLPYTSETSVHSGRAGPDGEIRAWGLRYS